LLVLLFGLPVGAILTFVILYLANLLYSTAGYFTT